MRTLRTMMVRTRSSFSRILNRLDGRMRQIEIYTATQNERLSDLENQDGARIPGLEKKEHDRKGVEKTRTDALSDTQLKSELDKQYGDTQWGTKIVAEIMDKRIPRV